MKKLLIPATLLLIATSAFAQVNQEFDDFQKQSQASFDSFLNDAQNQFNDFAGQINAAKQDQEKAKQEQMNKEFASEMPDNMQTYKVHEPIPAPVRNNVASVCPENDFICVCGDNKYCKTHAKIMLKTKFQWDKIVKALKDKENYRQALYKRKWMLTQPYGNIHVETVEKSEIQQLSSFEEVKDYIMGVPLLDNSLQAAAEKLAQYYQKTKEEKAFIKNLIKVLDNIETCTYDLDVNNYGFDNFCTLSQADGNPNIMWAAGILADIK